MLRQLQVEDGFPKNISNLGFPSRIKSVDAALHFRNDRYTVFFTGNECWRYFFPGKGVFGALCSKTVIGMT